MSELQEFLWSKSNPRKSLYCHMYEAAAVVKILLTDSIYAPVLDSLAFWLNLNHDETLRLLMYLAALHDIGKAHPLFQFNSRVGFAKDFMCAHPSLKYFRSFDDYRHEMGSYDAAVRIWKSNSVFGDKETRKNFAEILSLHHQGKQGKPHELYEKSNSAWTKVQDELERRFREELSPPDVSIKNMRHVDAACTITTALIIMTDWIISSEVLCDNRDPLPEEEMRKKVHQFLTCAGLDRCNVINDRSIYEIWSWMKPETLRPIQRELNDSFSSKEKMPMLVILEAPMGEGKTEAGIYTALRMAQYTDKNGIYIGLPTAATSNQMQTRVNALLEAHHIGRARLLHSMAWLNDENDSTVSDNEQEYSDWMKPDKRAILSPWAVGTIDQAMMAVMSVKYGVLHLLGLSGKVLVLDEIHAYDAYMSSIIIRLLEWCQALKIPVVMMSATLPSEKRAQFLSIYTNRPAEAEGYPLISSVYEDGTLEQTAVRGSYQQNLVHIDVQYISAEASSEIARMSVEKSRNGGCVCVIVNTVKEAQKIYREIKNLSYDGVLMLFHAKFSAARRKEIEEQCVRLFGADHTHRPAKAILVATQVAEQSLDLDFDAMITELAPVDLLIQRLGRMHRHKDTVRPDSLKTPVLTVLVPPEGEKNPSELIYYPLYLNRTADLLKEQTIIEIPDDIPFLVNQVYSGQTVSAKEAEAFWQQQFQDEIKIGQAELQELRSPDTREFSMIYNSVFFDDSKEAYLSAKTRLGEESVKVAIVPVELYRCVEEYYKKGNYISSETAKSVMLYSISVRKNEVKSIDADSYKDKVITGKGKLFGVRICKADEGGETPTDSVKVYLGDNCIISDCEYGFIIKKGR